ncbi:uncharacterized protein LOC131679853 [Topomyia yanbarensis]|uniref:uncharacterized protein LOC131679853 n=1 Tax=Topomyia yanbarensis TaxID=2498891 RepID=UPI00273BB569|nr:uncharacterized protein LOC131679853 [Topomyia yanbarensis]
MGETWRKYHQQLHLLNQIHVDRCVIIPRAVVMEFHCFSDASLKAYGASLYVRSIDTGRRVNVQFITSKSKVAPVKCMTIPRSGVDYFGPIYVRPAPRRAAVKAYAAIFVCLCRFVARRGKPTNIYANNGTNFVGARNKLREVLRLLQDKQHQETVSIKCAEEGIRWQFSPPSAPHFGGLWEAAVRSAKHHQRRVIGDSVVSPEDMNTLLVQVEGCLNSRPLISTSDDPNDLEPLTPAHFLVGSSLQSLPEQHLQAVMQRMLQDFRRRWQREYLCQL